MADKTVLVELDNHSREVSFLSGDDEPERIKEAVMESFKDIFGDSFPFYLQIFSKKWDRYVDLCVGQLVPDGSILRVVKESESQKVNELMKLEYLNNK